MASRTAAHVPAMHAGLQPGADLHRTKGNMTTTDDLPPGVEEQYLKASTTSNLRVKADKRGDADILIAAGWSCKGFGGALLRLAGEWDAAAKKPRGMSDTDLILLRGRLKSLTSALQYLTDAMHRLGMPSPEVRAGAIVGYWLHQACHTCHGLKFETIQNTPVLSANRCKACHGTGLGWAPYGQDGRRMLNLMDDSVSRARNGIRDRLRAYHK